MASPEQRKPRDEAAEDDLRSSQEVSGIRELPKKKGPEFKTQEEKMQMTKEERREWYAKVRESVGQEVRGKYLAESSNDTPDMKAYKESLAGLSLEDTIKAMAGGDETRVASTLAALGMERRTYVPKNKKNEALPAQERWNLKNPDPEAKAAGSYAEPEDLKAFVVGFALAKSIAEQLRVVADVYRYIGLEAPEITETADEMELTEDDIEVIAEPTAKKERPLPPALPKETGKKEAVPAEDPRSEPVPLSAWRDSLVKMRSMGKKAALGLSFLLAMNALSPDRGSIDHSLSDTDRITDDGRDPASTTSPTELTQPSPERSATDDIHRLAKGETVVEVVKDMMGDKAEDKDAFRKEVVEVLRANGIEDARFGVNDGNFDAANLPIGTPIDVSAVRVYLDHEASIDTVRGNIAEM